MAITAPTRTSDIVRASLQKGRKSPLEIAISTALFASLLVSLVVLVTLVADVTRRGAGVIADRGVGFLSSTLSADPSEAGILQGIMGSLALIGFVVVIAFPLGVAAAIYLEEYAKDSRMTRILTANIRNLAGVPSIVYGLLGLSVFVKLAEPITNGRTVLAGGLTLAVLVLPIMIITTSEALRAVPSAIREASLGVGATRWETIRHHVLPVAAPGILTGSVLTVARAFGESAPLLLAGAVLSSFFATSSDAGLVDMLTDQPYTALPIIVFNWARQPQEEFVALTAAAIIVLLVLLLTVNAIAIVARDRIEQGRRA